MVTTPPGQSGGPMKRLSITVRVAIFFAIFTLNAHASVSFLGVAAGDATSTSAILWTRAVDSAVPANTSLMLEYSTSPLPSDVLDQLSALLRGVTQKSGA